MRYLSDNILWYFSVLAGGWKCHPGIWGSVSRADWPDPQELPQTGEPSCGCRGVGPGGDHQHADPLLPHTVHQPKQRREYSYSTVLASSCDVWDFGLSLGERFFSTVMNAVWNIGTKSPAIAHTVGDLFLVNRPLFSSFIAIFFVTYYCLIELLLLKLLLLWWWLLLFFFITIIILFCLYIFNVSNSNWCSAVGVTKA